MTVSGTGISGSPTVSSKTATSVTLNTSQDLDDDVVLTFEEAAVNRPETIADDARIFVNRAKPLLYIGFS